MTNEQEKARELAELLNAFADKKQLQRLNLTTNKWIDTNFDNINELFNIVVGIHCPIRIKPETKRIALNQQDLIDRELSGKSLRLIRGKDSYALIVDYSQHIVMIREFYSDIKVEEEISYAKLMKYNWLDNSPCYKEVECEDL